MTELTFLVELLLNHKLPKLTKDLIASRIREVEGLLSVTSVRLPAQPVKTQVISARDVAARNPDLVPEPVVHVAQTQAAAAALASREQAISESIAGKIDKVVGRPRKF